MLFFHRFAFGLWSVLALLSAVSVQTSVAAPAGESVKSGSASFQRGAGFLTINQHSARVLIKWQDFSIAAGEITQFIQPSSKSVAVNLVNSGNPSLIYGSLQANGKVYLYNSSGIVVGPGGQIDTHQFVASTLLPKNGSFLKHSRLRLTDEEDAAGSIKNEGSIHSLGGDVLLIARHVENSGTISAPQGKVTVAAGTEVILQERRGNSIAVIAQQPARTTPSTASVGTGIDNSGVIEATAAELKAAGGNIYALAINNGGLIRAHASVHKPGQVSLQANGGTIRNSGAIEATDPNGGGTIQIDAGHSAGPAATVINSGTIAARGEGDDAVGGRVQLTGDQVTLAAGSRVDVSGDAGGGTALIGGGAHGRDRSVRNALETTIEAGAEVYTDALHHGNGGNIVLWSDTLTRVVGSLFARGGSLGGDGGHIETSSRLSLDLRQITGIDASAPAGVGGTWLVDPTDITIIAGPGDLGLPFTPTADANTIQAGVIDTVLNGGTSVSISTASSFNGRGNIVVDAPITKTAGGAASLTLTADGAITVNEAITTTSGNLSLSLNAGTDVQLNAPIRTLSGSLDVFAGGQILGLGPLVINGTTTLSATGDISLTGANDFSDVSIVQGRSATLNDIDDILLGPISLVRNPADPGSGNLTVTAGDTINDIAAVNVGGVASFNAGVGDINLDQNGLFGELQLNGGIAEVISSGAVTLGASTLSALTVEAASGGIQSVGALTVAGNATFLAAGQDITLTTPGSTFGPLFLTGHKVEVTEAAAMELGGATASGDLTVHSAGAITQQGVLAVDGQATFDLTAAGQNITLDQANLFRGDILLTAANGAGDILLRNLAPDSIGVPLLQVPASLANLTVTFENSTRPIQLTAMNASGRVDLRTGGNIALDALVVGGDVTLAAGQAVTLGQSTVGGILSLTAGSDITTSGLLAASQLGAEAGGKIALGPSTVAGDMTLAAGEGITFQGPSTVGGTLSVQAGGDIRDTPLADTEFLTVGNGAEFNALGAGADIDLQHLDLTGGTLRLTTTTTITPSPENNPLFDADATVVNKGELSLGASQVEGKLSLTTKAGNITDTALAADEFLTVDNGAAFKTEGANASINLQHLDLTGGTLSLDTTRGTEVSFAANATVLNTVGLNLGSSHVDGTFSLTATDGNITQSGIITADTLTLIATEGGITLGDHNLITTLGAVVHKNDFYLYNDQSLTLNGAITASDGAASESMVTIRAHGDLTLDVHTSIKTTGDQNDVILSSEENGAFGDFFNKAGLTAIEVDHDKSSTATLKPGSSGSRYIIYSRAPGNNGFNGDPALTLVTDPDAPTVKFNGLGSNWRFSSDKPTFGDGSHLPTFFAAGNKNPEFRNGYFAGNGFVFQEAQAYPSNPEAAKFYIDLVKLNVFEGFDFNFDITKLRTLSPPSIYTTSYHVYEGEKEAKEKRKQRGLIAGNFERVRLAYDAASDRSR